MRSLAPNEIAEAAYGKRIGRKQERRRATIQPLLPCIVDGRPCRAILSTRLCGGRVAMMLVAVAYDVSTESRGARYLRWGIDVGSL